MHVVLGYHRHWTASFSLHLISQGKSFLEFLLWHSGLTTQLVSLEALVRSLALHGGLRIQCCHSRDSHSVPGLGPTMCHRCGQKRKKEKHQGKSCCWLGTYERTGVAPAAVKVGIFNSHKLLRGGLDSFHVDECGKWGFKEVEWPWTSHH